MCSGDGGRQQDKFVFNLTILFTTICPANSLKPTPRAHVHACLSALMFDRNLYGL